MAPGLPATIPTRGMVGTIEDNWSIPECITYHLLSIIFLVVIGTFIVSSAVRADEVSYDEIDYNALSLSAQSQQPQAADQFAKIYRQVLIFDENNYGTSYNQDMLEASLFAGSAVLSLDDESPPDGFRMWLITSSSLALEDLGYAQGSDKMLALQNANRSLASAHNKTLDCVVNYLLDLGLCIIGIPFVARAGSVSWNVFIIARTGIWVGRYVAAAINAAQWIFYKLWYPLTLACAAVATIRLLWCLYAGSTVLTGIVRRRLEARQALELKYFKWLS